MYKYYTNIYLPGCISLDQLNYRIPHGSKHLLRRYKTPPSHHTPVPLPKKVRLDP